MSNKKSTVSIWDESMRIGVDIFDDERRQLLAILEHLDVNPLQTISSEFFRAKFNIYDAAVRSLFAHEETLLGKFDVPEKVKKLHKDEHDRIVAMLNSVNADSINKRNQTAIDVYQLIRSDMTRRLSEFGQELRKYVREV